MFYLVNGVIPQKHSGSLTHMLPISSFAILSQYLLFSEFDLCKHIYFAAVDIVVINVIQIALPPIQNIFDWPCYESIRK